MRVAHKAIARTPAPVRIQLVGALRVARGALLAMVQKNPAIACRTGLRLAAKPAWLKAKTGMERSAVSEPYRFSLAHRQNWTYLTPPQTPPHSRAYVHV